MLLLLPLRLKLLLLAILAEWQADFVVSHRQTGSLKVQVLHVQAESPDKRHSS